MKGIKVVDIRNISGKKTNVVRYNEGQVLFSEEISEGDISYFVINKYEVKNNKSYEVYRHEIPHYEFYSQYIKFFDDKVVILDKSHSHELKIKILDCRSFSEIKSLKYNFEGELSSIPIFINEQYVLFYEDICGIQEKENICDSLDYRLYLIDTLDKRPYLIRDSDFVKGVNIVHCGSEGLPIVKGRNDSYLIYNQSHMDDYEYEEDVYMGVKSGRFTKEDVESKELLAYISLSKFVQEIKDGKENISFTKLLELHVDGWVRYMYCNGCKLIYRTKNFNSQLENILELDFESMKTTEKAHINHREISGRLIYGNEVYEEKENQYWVSIKGIFNCDYNIKFKHRNHTHFEGLMKNRYIVTSRWFEDDKERYFDHVTIRDTIDNTMIDYPGDCEIHGDHIIIFDRTGFMNE